MRILAMILPQHPNEDEDEDMDTDIVDEVSEEEELQVVTSIKQTGHQEEIMLKLSHHVTRECNCNLRLKLSHHVTRECNPNLRLRLFHNVTRECNPNLRLKLSHHVTRECNPNLRLRLFHNVTRECNPNLRLKLSHHVTRAQNPKLYQPQAQAVPLPLVIPIVMHYVPLAVGQSGHPLNVQLLYGPLVPQNDEDHLLSGSQQL